MSTVKGGIYRYKFVYRGDMSTVKGCIYRYMFVYRGDMSTVKGGIYRYMFVYRGDMSTVKGCIYRYTCKAGQTGEMCIVKGSTQGYNAGQTEKVPTV